MRSLYTEGRRRQVNTTDMQTEQRACWQTTLQSNGQTYAPGTEGRGLAVAGQPSPDARGYCSRPGREHIHGQEAAM